MPNSRCGTPFGSRAVAASPHGIGMTGRGPARAEHHEPVTDPCTPGSQTDITLARRRRGDVIRWETVMQRTLKLLTAPVALTIAVALGAAAMMPSGALAATHERSAKVRHVGAAHDHHAGYHRHRAYRSYGAIPGGAYGAIPGGPGFSSPSYPGYGYGYGDNSHGCSACVD